MGLEHGADTVFNLLPEQGMVLVYTSNRSHKKENCPCPNNSGISVSLCKSLDRLGCALKYGCSVY